MSHKRARESTSDKENSTTTPAHGKPVMIKKQRLDLDTFRSAGGKTKNKPKVHAIMQEQLRARQAREILTPPPSSELDIQLPEQDEVHRQHTQPRKVQFRPAPSSQNQSHADSMYRLMTTPMETLMSSSPVMPTSPLKEDYALTRPGRARGVSSPVSLVTLAVDYDGSHNLILGRSRKTSLSPSTLHVIEEAGPSNQMIDSKTLPTSFPSDLASKLPTGSSSTRAISTLPTRLLPLPRKAQHTSRNHVLVTPSSSASLPACLFVHVMGQNGCRVRILGARTAGIPYHHQVQHVGVEKRYTAGRVVTIRSPTTATGGRGLVVDIEIDMYSCKTIVHWAVPTRSEDVSGDDDDETESESEDVLRPWNLELKRLHPDQPQFVRLPPDHEEREDTPEAPSGQNQRVSSGPLMFQPSSGLGLVAPLSPPTSSPSRLPSLDLAEDEEEEKADVEMSMVADMCNDDRQRDDDEDDEDAEMDREGILNDLPPSSPPMDLESLPAFPEDEDEDETQVEMRSDAQSVVFRPTSPVETFDASALPVKARDFAVPALAPSALGLESKPTNAVASASTFIRRPAPAQPTASSSSSSSGFFGFDLGAPSRKNVVVRKVMISRPASASSVRSRESTPALKVKDKEKDAELEKKTKKATEVQTLKPIVVTAPTPAPEPVTVEAEKSSTPVTIEEASSIPETPLNTTSALPEPSTPLTPLPLSPELSTSIPTIPDIVPAVPTTTLETTTTTSMTTVEPPSSPARSIYSQMTSDSESEGEAEPGQKETVGVVRRLGEMQKRKTKAKSTSHVRGIGGKSKAVKRELIEAGENEEVKEVKKRKVDVSTALTSSDTVNTATSEIAAPAPAVTTETTTPPALAESDSNSTPHPPKDLDLKALVATSVVFSGVSAISAFDLVKTILDVSSPFPPSFRNFFSFSFWILIFPSCDTDLR
jgi:hypothetical protein